jgi:hypothetical protein
MHIEEKCSCNLRLCCALFELQLNVQSVMYFIYVGVYIYIYIYIYIYTGCLRNNLPYFGRIFLGLNWIDLVENTYIRSRKVTEIITRYVLQNESCHIFINYQVHTKTRRNL